MRFFRLLSAGVVVFLLLACGGGGGSANPETAWQGSVDENGYPLVAGKFSFQTVDISTVCTDGTEFESEPIELTFSIHQEGGQLLIESSASDSSGLIIKEATDAAGNMDKEGKFAVLQTIVFFDEEDDDITVNYTLTGNFSPNTWNGTYRFEVLYSISNISCTSETDFFGEKLSVINQMSLQEEPWNGGDLIMSAEKIKYLFGTTGE